jgi:hypothetical protein
MLALGSKAPDFQLWEPGGASVAFDDFRDSPVLMIMFICNKSQKARIVMESLQTRIGLFLFLLIADAMLESSSSAYSQDFYFPPSIFLPRNKEVNSIIDDMNSVPLEAMKEPSLWKLSQKDQAIVSYRFLWRATGMHPTCIRLTRTGETFTLHVARHDGPPGLIAGKLTVNKDVKLSVQQGQQLVALLQNTRFWTAPVSVKESNGISDGDAILIEGVKEGKYQVIDRAGSTMGESYKAFCRSLLELANQPDELKAWDHYRKGERDSPNYIAEPPQTLDEGDDSN